MARGGIDGGIGIDLRCILADKLIGFEGGWIVGGKEREEELRMIF